MANVKTAISIDKSLFEAAQRLARKLKLSRSRLFASAMEEYIERRSNRRLLAELNAAHVTKPNAEEVSLRREALRSHRTLVEGDW